MGNCARGCENSDNIYDLAIYIDNLLLSPGNEISISTSYLYYPRPTPVTDQIVSINFPNNQLDTNRSNNGDSLLITSTDEFAVNQNPLTAFPNPSSGNWSVTGIPAGEHDWTLTDLTGRTVTSGLNHLVADEPLDVNGADLPTGIYVLRVGKNVIRLVRD